MRCFYHPELAAIGTCKACCKGLCASCAADLDEGLACQDRHEALVAEMNVLIRRNTKAQTAAAGGGVLIMPAFFAFMGSMFIGTALYAGRGWLSGGVLMGSGFLLFGLIFYFYNRRIFRPANDA